MNRLGHLLQQLFLNKTQHKDHTALERKPMFSRPYRDNEHTRLLSRDDSSSSSSTDEPAPNRTPYDTYSDEIWAKRVAEFRMREHKAVDQRLMDLLQQKPEALQAALIEKSQAYRRAQREYDALTPQIERVQARCDQLSKAIDEAQVQAAMRETQLARWTSALGSLHARLKSAHETNAPTERIEEQLTEATNKIHEYAHTMDVHHLEAERQQAERELMQLRRKLPDLSAYKQLSPAVTLLMQDAAVNNKASAVYPSSSSRRAPSIDNDGPPPSPYDAPRDDAPGPNNKAPSFQPPADALLIQPPPPNNAPPPPPPPPPAAALLYPPPPPPPPPNNAPPPPPPPPPPNAAQGARDVDAPPPAPAMPQRRGKQKYNNIHDAVHAAGNDRAGIQHHIGLPEFKDLIGLRGISLEGTARQTVEALWQRYRKENMQEAELAGLVLEALRAGKLNPLAEANVAAIHKQISALDPQFAQAGAQRQKAADDDWSDDGRDPQEEAGAQPGDIQRLAMEGLMARRRAIEGN
jgi:hypothetical protein